MAPPERRALLLLLSLAIAGHVVRRIAMRPGDPPGQIELLPSLTPGSPAAHRDSALRQQRPLEPGERIDLDRASAQEIARLPRVGLPLAKTIVADRETNGPFGSLAGLDRVAGVGPGLLKRVEPHVTFSALPALASRASQENRSFLGVAQTTSYAVPSAVNRTPTNLNTASVSDLDALPGVGQARAKAIVQYRETHGPFLSVESLVRVPGIGPAALARLRSLVTVH
jgi:competence protein ComEA